VAVLLALTLLRITGALLRQWLQLLSIQHSLVVHTDVPQLMSFKEEILEGKWEKGSKKLWIGVKRP
jgi:hypothetical protein